MKQPAAPAASSGRSVWSEPDLFHLGYSSSGRCSGQKRPLLQQERILLKATLVRPVPLVCTKAGAGPLAAGRSGMGSGPPGGAGCQEIPPALVSPGPGSCCECVLGCGEHRLPAFQRLHLQQWRHGACTQLLSENQVLDVIATF